MNYPAQLFLFDEPVEKPPLTGMVPFIVVPELDGDVDNFLIQEIVDAGRWSDLAYLIDARDELRNDVRESCASPDDFLIHETRNALKLVANRIQELQSLR